MDLSARVALGDRVAAELLLVGSDSTLDNVNPETVTGWRAALIAYIDSGLDDAVAVLERTRPAALPPRESVRFLSLAAVWYRAWGDRTRSRDLVSRADAAGRDLDPATRAACHRGMALQASHDGDAALSDEHYRAALDLVPGAHGTLLALLMTLYRSRHALDHERLTEAVAESEAAVRLCRMAGYLSYEPFALNLGADAKAHLGRLSDALMDAVHAERLRETTGVRHDGAFALFVRGGVHRRRREVAQARAVLEAAVKDLPAGPAAGRLEIAILAELGRVCVTEDPSLARLHVRRAVEGAAGGGRIAALLARGWVSLMSGDTVTATADADEVRTVTSSDDRPASMAEALELLGLVTTDPQSSATLFREASTFYRTVGDRPGEARVRTAAAAVRGVTGSRSARWEEETLRHQGVSLEPGVADALTVVARRAPLIAVHCLGGFRVLRAGSGVAPSEWQSKKARDLLKILVSCRGRPVPRARLMELLWPGQSPATGGSRLSVQLSTLRRVLDPERRIQHASPIVADRAAIAVNLDLVQVDIERFLIAASDAAAAHRHDDGDAGELLSAAAALYVGEFMPEDPYADWAQELRDEAAGAYVGVLRAQVSRSSDVDHRVSCLLRILRCDSYDEEAHVELVHVLQQAGRHGEARRRYRAYARCMQEIGVAPAAPRDIFRGITPTPAVQREPQGYRNST